MEDTKKQDAGRELSGGQAAEVGGGATCGATATVGTSGGNVSSSASTPGEAMTSIYDGVVETTSHVIETVANALK